MLPRARFGQRGGVGEEGATSHGRNENDFFESGKTKLVRTWRSLALPLQQIQEVNPVKMQLF